MPSQHGYALDNVWIENQRNFKDSNHIFYAKVYLLQDFVDLKNLFRLLVSAIKIKDLVIVNAVARASGDTESD